jgi:hypothetical protein
MRPPPPPPPPIGAGGAIRTGSPFADPIPRPPSGYYPEPNRNSGYGTPPAGFANEYNDYGGGIPNPHAATPRPPTVTPGPYGQQAFALSDGGFLPPPQQHVQFDERDPHLDAAPLLPGPPGGRHSPPHMPSPMPGQYPPRPTSTVGYQPGATDSELEQGENNIRYGRIPQRIPRRYKTVKKFELFHGNYVYDAPTPNKILNFISPKYRTEREFNTMRYTGATCDPNDFKDKGFTLRQVCPSPLPPYSKYSPLTYRCSTTHPAARSSS